MSLPVSSMPILDNGPPTGPIEYGIIYMVRPFIEFVSLFLTSSLASGMDIQFPSGVHFNLGKFSDASGVLNPWTGVGIVSICFVVEMNVLDSTLATSFGSVHVNQLIF